VAPEQADWTAVGVGAAVREVPVRIASVRRISVRRTRGAGVVLLHLGVVQAVSVDETVEGTHLRVRSVFRRQPPIWWIYPLARSNAVLQPQTHAIDEAVMKPEQRVVGRALQHAHLSVDKHVDASVVALECASVVWLHQSVQRTAAHVSVDIGLRIEQAPPATIPVEPAR